MLFCQACYHMHFATVYTASTASPMRFITLGVGVGTEWLAFCRQHFQMKISWIKVIIFYANFTEVVSQGSNWQHINIGSGNGLVPNRPLAITWTNDDPYTMHICITRGSSHNYFHQNWNSMERCFFIYLPSSDGWSLQNFAHARTTSMCKKYFDLIASNRIKVIQFLHWI